MSVAVQAGVVVVASLTSLHPSVRDRSMGRVVPGHTERRGRPGQFLANSGNELRVEWKSGKPRTAEQIGGPGWCGANGIRCGFRAAGMMMVAARSSSSTSFFFFALGKRGSSGAADRDAAG